MLLLQDLLNIPAFSYFTVINTDCNLKRVVANCDISETPDISKYIEPHTLLITTGMIYVNDVEGFCRLIKELDKLPVCGLAIKLGRFIDKIDEKVIETANELNFPLLKVPIDITLGTACYQVLSILCDYQTEKLQYAINIQQQFLKMLMQRASLTNLVKHLGFNLKSNILLIDPFIEILASSCKGVNEHKKMHEAHRIVKENFSVYKNLDKEHTFSIETNKNAFTFVRIFPLRVNSLNPHLLLIWDYDKIPYPFSQLVIELATNILAFTIYKNIIDFENNLNLNATLFSKLLKDNTKFTQKEHLLLYGESFGIIDSPYYQIVVASIDNFEDYTHFYSHDIYSKSLEWLHKQIKASYKDSLVFPSMDNQHFNILLQNQPQKIEEVLQHISKKLEELFNISLSFAIGNEVQDITFIWYSYVEAVKTFEKHKKQNQKHFIESYFSTEVSDLVQFIPHKQASHFAICILKELSQPTDTLHLDLRKTLKTYLDCQGDITKTAKCLFVHRNTVKYRIEKLNDILGCSIDDPQNSLELRLALLITETSSL